MIYYPATKRTSSMRLRTLIHVGACYLAMAVAITIGIAGTAGAFGGIRQVSVRIDPHPPYPTNATPLADDGPSGEQVRLHGQLEAQP